MLVTPTSGLVTNEAGTFTATFTVRLTSQPTANVLVPFGSDDAGEGLASPTSVVFSPANWDTPKTISVTGVDDDVADGHQSYAVDIGPATSLDGNYSGMLGPSVGVLNLDDETRGINVSPTAGLITTEGGLADTFDVVLNSQPTADVIITLSGDDTEGSLSDTMLTFTPSNWDMAQTVTVTGVEDTVADGNQQYLVVGDPSGSADSGYAGLTPFSVEITNLDND
jgi:hypothetical protein